MVVDLRENQDLEQLLEQSKTHPVIIFKHSTQCSISGSAYEEFESFVENAPDVVCGLVLVIENRSISHAIETRLGVRHESPQAIIVKDGRSIWTASHRTITADLLTEALQSHAQPSST